MTKERMPKGTGKRGAREWRSKLPVNGKRNACVLLKVKKTRNEVGGGWEGKKRGEEKNGNKSRWEDVRAQ